MSESMKNHKNTKVKTKKLAFCGMIIALGCVTSMIKLYQFPFGGSVTFFSMLVISLAGYFFGPLTGILTACTYGVLQFLLNPYVLFPLQVIVDYLLAFGALGLSGLFYRSRYGLFKGYLAGILGRYFFVVLSGCLFFGAYAWEGWSPLLYSLVYNGAYIFTEGILTFLILLVPSVRKALDEIKHSIV